MNTSHPSGPPPRILSIAGSDSSGGAGVQADIKTITMLGGYAMTAITAITAQNTIGVQGIAALAPEMVATVLAHGFTIDLAAKLLGVKGETRPGLLLVGSTPWTIALAEMMRELKTPVMLVDSSWQRLKPARRKDLPYYHGEILNEATEHNLDLSPYQALVAATENEAYNTLVCSEFAHEIGRDAVYQIGESGDGDDRQSMSEALRGRALFESGYGVDEIAERLAQGWQLRKTKLSDNFKFEDAKDVLPPSTNLLMLLKGDGRMQFFTHAARPDPGPGDTVISFAPAKVRTGAKREKAAVKASKALPTLMAVMALVGCSDNRNDSAVAAPETPAPETPAPVPRSIMRTGIVAAEPEPGMLAPLEVTIGFADASAELSDEATKMLQAMLGSPQFDAGAAITIDAHTDSAGSDAANLAVSRKRGMQVRDWFVEHGVAAERITLVTFGEQNPVEPNPLPDGSPNEAGRKANRRVEVRMVASTDTSPSRRGPTLAEDLVNQLNGDASPRSNREAVPDRAR